MRLGVVYEWQPDQGSPSGGHVRKVTRELPRLGGDGTRLVGSYVRVINRGMVRGRDPVTGLPFLTPIGDAQPDGEGNFFFEPGKGGGRMDKIEDPDPTFQQRYIQAARFGEANVYYHLDRMACYIDGLLKELGAASLPQVVAVVCAHGGVEERDGIRDGVRRAGYRAFQGGHYRLPRHRHDIPEWYPVSPDGEIHLGPGRQLLHEGALVDLAGDRYRSNASHIAGIIYHEYGHHLTRHAADFRANALRPIDRQSNIKTFLDEGTADYWVAVMLESPHIWAWHHKHDAEGSHPRSLASAKSMKDFDPAPEADPHANGTLWAAALWDLRREMSKPSGREADRLVLQALLEIGASKGRTIRETVALRSTLDMALKALLKADQLLYQGQHRSKVVEVFKNRGIQIEY